MSTATDLLQSVKIKVLLLADSRVSGLDVSVDVDNGVAHLTGTVETEEQKWVAEEIAGGVEGVEEVENEIVVASRQDQLEDLEMEALADMPTEVPGMIVPAEAPPAYGGPAPGIMTVQPPDEVVTREQYDLLDRVRDALRVDTRIKSENIKVHEDKGKILLHGSVRSFDEFNAVDEIVAGTAGVTTITNDLEIDEAGGCICET